MVSGNLPISSAEMASTTPVASRFKRVDSLILERIPVTSITSTSALADTSSADNAGSAVAPSINDKLVAILVLVNVF